MLAGAKIETRSKYRVSSARAAMMHSPQHLISASNRIKKPVAFTQECKDVRDPTEIDRLCDEALDAAKFLKETIVQAKLNERGNYGAPQPAAACE